MILKIPATEEEVQELKHSVQVIDSIKIIVKIINKIIKNYNNLNTFMQNNCKSAHYDFQIHKCKDEPCKLCNKIQPVHLSQEIFDGLPFLPDSLLGEKKGLFSVPWKTCWNYN